MGYPHGFAQIAGCDDLLQLMAGFQPALRFKSGQTAERGGLKQEDYYNAEGTESRVADHARQSRAGHAPPPVPRPVLVTAAGMSSPVRRPNGENQLQDL